MPVDWKAPDAYERLLAAVMAANDCKPLDYRKIATYYGRGATYDSVEGKCRKLKTLAKELHEEIASGSREAAPSRGPVTPAKRSKRADTEDYVPDFGLKTTIGGRVSKNGGKGTPRKKRKGGVSVCGPGRKAGDGEAKGVKVEGEGAGEEEGAGEVAFGVVSDAEILGEQEEVGFGGAFDEEWQRTVSGDDDGYRVGI